jgi:uncharacterized membrane protein YhaH (DUF805 family)
MNTYVSVLTRYATFTGRARRSEYWIFTLVSAAIALALAVVDALVFGTGSVTALSGGGSVSAAVSIGVLSTIYSLAVLLPGLAVTVRRLHDTDRSGWWVLVALVPFVGGIVLLVLLVLEGTRGPNLHGADPKAVPVGARY